MMLDGFELRGRMTIVAPGFITEGVRISLGPMEIDRERDCGDALMSDLSGAL